jgi:hypothetical protein
MRPAWIHAQDASGHPPIAKFVTAVTAGRAGTCFLDPMRQETGVGIMTRKIKLDRYDLVIAAAFALFALVAVSLMLTS